MTTRKKPARLAQRDASDDGSAPARRPRSSPGSTTGSGTAPASAPAPITGPAPVTHGRKAQGEQTKQAILDAALELYAETGFRGTGLIAIGERAGVTHATVLYHYGSSHELLMAVLEERERRFR